MRNLAWYEVGGEFECIAVNSRNHENPFGPFALVYSTGALLATGYCTDFYSTNSMANSIAVPHYWIHN